jgi:Sulfotransferase family
MKRRERPIVICGAARSGTTALSFMLNQHSEIGLAREIELVKLPSLPSLLEETAAHHGNAWTERRRAEVVRALWFFVGRPVERHRFEARRWGTKTPWSEFNADLWDPLVEPVWLYVLRRGDGVFQSHIRLGWSEGGKPKVLLNRYKQSVRIGEEMAARGSAHICQLDLADDVDSRQRLAEGIFEFLEEEIDSGVQEFIDRWPRPPATSPAPDDEDAELPDEWQALLDSDPEYQEMMLGHGY